MIKFCTILSLFYDLIIKHLYSDLLLISSTIFNILISVRYSFLRFNSLTKSPDR